MDLPSSCSRRQSAAGGARVIGDRRISAVDPNVEAHRSAEDAFSEDKVVIEAQQKRLTEYGEEDSIDIRSDSARVSMRRTINRMLGKEAAV